MKGTQVSVAPITCQLSNLTVFTTEADAEYSDIIIKQDESFAVSVTVQFVGSGAIALMPLGMSIKVNFLAEPYGIGSKIELGDTSVKTSAETFIYTPTLAIAKPTSVGLVRETIYQVIAVLRVGAPDWPAWITGFIEGLAIQTY